MNFQRCFLKSLFCFLVIFVSKSDAQMNMSSHAGTGNRNIYLMMMDTMMKNMESVTPLTPFETDFIGEMIPHHMGAVSMAEYEIKYGRNAEMIQLAKSIRTEQSYEIQLMRIWLEHYVSPVSEISNDYRSAMAKSMNKMMDNMPLNEQMKDIDQSFARVMIPHHQAAIDMSEIILSYTKDQQPVLVDSRGQLSKIN
jgi:uncharacterized protein (DUF305 family)